MLLSTAPEDDKFSSNELSSSTYGKKALGTAETENREKDKERVVESQAREEANTNLEDEENSGDYMREAAKPLQGGGFRRRKTEMKRETAIDAYESDGGQEASRGRGGRDRQDEQGTRQKRSDSRSSETRGFDTRILDDDVSGREADFFWSTKTSLQGGDYLRGSEPEGERLQNNDVQEMEREKVRKEADVAKELVSLR